VVLPKNFDNPDEAFELANLWAKRREKKLLGLDRIIAEIRTRRFLERSSGEQDAKPDNDQAE